MEVYICTLKIPPSYTPNRNGHIYPKDMYKNVHWNIIYNSKSLKQPNYVH